MRADYKSLCVRFREDDPAHMAAYEFLQGRVTGGRSYADIIAELVAEKCGQSDDGTGVFGKNYSDELTGIKHICSQIWEKMSRCAYPPVENDANDESSIFYGEDKQDKMAFSKGIADFILGSGDDDDD